MTRKTSTILSVAISIVLIALGVGFLYSHNLNFWPAGGRWSMGHHGFMGGGMGFVGILFWILIVAGLVLLITAVVNGLGGTGRVGREARNPLDVLKLRYARGEIDTAEYEKMRRELSGWR